MIIYASLWTHCKHLYKSRCCLFKNTYLKCAVSLRVLEFEWKQYAQDLLKAEHSFHQTVELASGVFLTIIHGYDMQKHVHKSTSVSKLSGYMDAHTRRSQWGTESPLGYLWAKCMGFWKQKEKARKGGSHGAERGEKARTYLKWKPTWRHTPEFELAVRW